MTPEKKDGAQPGQFSLLGTASTMGLHMVSGPVVGGGLGWLVDEWLGSWPVASGVGLLLGLAAGFRNVWLDARYLEKKNDERDAEEKARPADAGKSARRAFYADAAPQGEEADKKEDAVASILAGTAVPGDGEPDDPEESFEAIRRALEEAADGKHSGAGKQHEHN